MVRVGLIGAVVLCVTGIAAGQQQRPVQWITNVQQGVAQAKRSGLPLLFYIAGSGRGGRDESDLKDAQQITLRNSLVRGIVQSRFVPVRLARSTDTQAMLDKMGARVGVGYCLIVATPDGELIGVIGPQQLTDARVLAKQLTEMFRRYRTKIFETDLKPKLEDEASSARDVIRALKVIDAMLITEADASVVKLVEKGGLSKGVAKQAYGTLATLSTPPAVKALLEAAAKDKQAAAALARCTPAGAEEMLGALDLKDPGKLIVAYEAVTKICKIRGSKPKGFWTGKNEQLLAAEIERVKEEAHRLAKQWKEKYEAYR